MASSDNWPPVAEAPGKNSGKNRANTNMKKSTTDDQQQVLSILLEMFQNNLETDIIHSVAENCHWQLQFCVEALIGLSSTVDTHDVRDSSNYDAIEATELHSNELKIIPQISKKSSKNETTATKNRMGSFRDNISKLNSNSNLNQQQSPKNFESIWDWPSTNTNSYNFNMTNAQFTQPQSNPWAKGILPHNCVEYKQEFGENQLNQTKAVSEWCGLKVQYRSARSSPEDDDADVVIEEEFENTMAPLMPINVSQFLSTSNQTAPRAVQSQKKIKTITTPSPSTTPKRTAHQRALDRIETTIKNGKKILILLRGLPGSGKSYLSKRLIMNIGGDPSYHIFSTDDYFIMLGRGIYKFDRRKLNEAHEFNQNRVFAAMSKGITPIIVDNTNSCAWEMRPYAAKAVKHEYIVETLEPNTPWAFNLKELAKKNCHGVSRNNIEVMLNRFEHNITGEKLLARFALIYNTSSNNIESNKKKEGLSKTSSANENINKQIVQTSNKSDDTLERISAFADYAREFDHSKRSNDVNISQVIKDETNSTVEQQSALNNPNESYSENKHNVLQEFGPIGSERRCSLATVEALNPSFPDEPSINSENNTNNSHLCQCSDFSLLTDGKVLHSCGESNNSVIRPLDPAEIQEQDEEFSKNSHMIKSDDERYMMLDQDGDDADKIIEMFNEKKYNADMIKTNTKIHGNNLEVVNSCELIQDKLIENKKEIHNKDMNSETLSDNIEATVNIASNSQSALGTIFNIIKGSILGNGNNDNSLQSIFKTEGHENKITDIENVNIDKNAIVEIKDATDSTDGGADFTVMIEKNDDKIDNMQICLDENFEKIEDKNVLISALEDMQKLNISQKVNKNTEYLEVAGHSDKSNVDNINCISWKESPFPVDDLVFSSDENDIGTNEIPKADVSTNTSYYDWNILYIGDTSDPSYRVIQPRNRGINETISLPKCEKTPPKKLMLDKSSMTGNIFTPHGNLELDDEQENYNRIPELMELFPHIPRDYLIDIFEKVQENFDWAVELLLEGVPEGLPDILKIPSKEESSIISENDEESTCATPEILNYLPNNNSSEGPIYENHDSPLLSIYEQENKNENSLYNIESEEILNNVVNPDIAKEIIGEEMFDDTASTSTGSVSRLESIDEEKNNDNDEIIELNLGFDCIKALEEKFGNFCIPEGFFPTVHIKKSLAEELYASWIESVYEQANIRDQQLEEMIAKDAELARSLESTVALEPVEESTVPNLEQIMDMEMALANHENELKAKATRETPDDMAARLSFQMLHESIPDMDMNTFNDILRVHNGNFKEAFEVIEINTGKVIAPTDTLKKQKVLMEKVKEENANLKYKRSPTIVVVRNETKDDKLNRVKESREEAQRQLSLRIQNSNKAVEAYQKGCPSLAGYYSEMSRLHSRNMEVAHAEAASAYVEAISYNNGDTLDLHSLSVFEALVAVEEFIDYHLNKLIKSNKRFIKLYIITGRGSRSIKGVSRLKPAVSQKLTSKNIKFSEYNTGCLKVTLYRQNAIAN